VGHPLMFPVPALALAGPSGFCPEMLIPYLQPIPLLIRLTPRQTIPTRTD